MQGNHLFCSICKSGGWDIFSADPAKAYIWNENLFLYVLQKKHRSELLLATHAYYFLFNTILSQMNNIFLRWLVPSTLSGGTLHTIKYFLSLTCIQLISFTNDKHVSDHGSPWPIKMINQGTQVYFVCTGYCVHQRTHLCSVCTGFCVHQRTQLCSVCTGFCVHQRTQLSSVCTGFCVHQGTLIYSVYTGKKKVKSSMAKSLPVENLLPQNVGSIINYLQ